MCTYVRLQYIEISGTGMITLVQHVPVQVGRLDGKSMYSGACTSGTG